MNIEIRDCRLCDLRAALAALREADMAELRAFGARPRHTLFRLWRRSSIRRALLADNAVVAVGGDAAPWFSEEGHLWLFTTALVEKLPLAYFKSARAELQAAFGPRETMRAHVSLDYPRALRFFTMMGFKPSERIEINGRAFVEISIARPG